MPSAQDWAVGGNALRPQPQLCTCCPEGGACCQQQRELASAPPLAATLLLLLAVCLSVGMHR